MKAGAAIRSSNATRTCPRRARSASERQASGSPSPPNHQAACPIAPQSAPVNPSARASSRTAAHPLSSMPDADTARSNRSLPSLANACRARCSATIRTACRADGSIQPPCSSACAITTAGSSLSNGHCARCRCRSIWTVAPGASAETSVTAGDTRLEYFSSGLARRQPTSVRTTNASSNRSGPTSRSKSAIARTPRSDGDWRRRKAPPLMSTGVMPRLPSSSRACATRATVARFRREARR